MNFVKVIINDERGNYAGVQAMDKHQWAVISNAPKAFAKLNKVYVEDLPFAPEPGDVLSPEKTGGSELAAYKRAHNMPVNVSSLESHPDYVDFVEYQKAKTEAFLKVKQEGYPGSIETFTMKSLAEWHAERAKQILSQETPGRESSLGLTTEEIDKKWNKNELMEQLSMIDVPFDAKQTKAELVDLYFANQKA